MTEIVFLVEDDPTGGFVARALGESIFTQADTLDELRDMVHDAVRCHFPNPNDRPKVIRLHRVQDEVIASCSEQLIEKLKLWIGNVAAMECSKTPCQSHPI